jgi:hypothetical protein
MRAVKIGAGVIIAMVGVVWMLQGFGASYVPTSFMTKAPEWIFIGLVTAVGGTVLAVRAFRNR